VVTPCYSTASPGKVFEGTRLTLQVNIFIATLTKRSMLLQKVGNILLELLVLHPDGLNTIKSLPSFGNNFLLK
jgi:hypothetical protein